ncbi:MAG: dienelactone hydrolase family protein [Mucilaginibacter polytrichastri]|nr:dienelactone hydrolase family protein [Mucilaginibacter polytrichastri]
MDQKIINLYDEYTHKPLTRQEFIRRLSLLTGSTALAMGLIPMLESNYAKAETVSEQDGDLIIEDVKWPGDGAEMKGYLARPKKEGKKGSVLVIHENRGLNAHIKDVARRVAKAGYIALAADALAPFGGTPENEDVARAQFANIDPAKNLNNFLKALDYLRKRPDSNGKTACVGFCWGGALANQLAVHDPKLQAAVAYYGRQPEAADVPKIKAKLMLHYGGLDERVNAGIPDYEKALKTAGVSYQLFVYEGANHAFNNDTAPARYDEKAAKLAWERTLGLFKSTIS